MNLSLALSGLFTASFLWCQGLSLTVEASTNEGNSSERQVDVESYRRPIKDVGSTRTTLKDDISVVQKSRNMQTMISNWVQRGDTVSADETAMFSEGFGTSVALNNKGTRLVVSAPNLSTVGNDGKIQIYDLVNSQWDLVQTIPGVGNTIEGHKGRGVSMTPLGNHIAVHNGGNDAVGGSFSVYKRDDTTGMFSQLGSTISEISNDDMYWSTFGQGIEISQNGERVALGSEMGGNMRGKAYVYEYDSTTSEWGIIFSITGSEGSVLGSNVSLAKNGKSIAVVSGYAYSVDVFEEDSSSNWVKTSLPLPDAIPGTAHYRGVSMSADGMRVALADTFIENIASTGGIYVFDKVGPDWVLTNEDTPLMDGGEYQVTCGSEVKFSADGTKLIMSCTGSMSYAIVFQEDGSGAWSNVGDIIMPNPSMYDSAVTSVAMADKKGGKNAAMIVAVGSPGNASPNGSAGVYKLENIPCLDSIAEMRMDTMNMDKIPFFCKWVNKGQGSTCNEYGLLEGHCPDSCGTCANYGCADSTATFIVRGSETSCMEVSGYDQTLVDILCENKRIRTSCRGTCGYCGDIDIPF